MSNFEYPAVGFRFSVNFGSVGGDPIDASFSEISGISVQVTAEEIEEGGDNRFTRRIPSKITYSPLVLKRGVSPLSSGLLTWLSKFLEEGTNTTIPCPDVVISLLDDENNPLISWLFEAVFPIKYEISGLKSTANQIAIETIELTYNKFYVI